MPGDPNAVLGACVLSGLMAGVRLLPTVARSRDLTTRIAEFEADRVNACSPDAIERFTRPGSLTLELTKASGGSVSMLLGDSHVVSAATVTSERDARDDVETRS
jgi:hypothetical protein